MRPVRVGMAVLVAVLTVLGVTVGLTIASNTTAHGARVAHREFTGTLDESAHPQQPAEVSTPNDDPRVYDMPHGNHVVAFWNPARRNVPWVVYVHGGFWSYGFADTVGTRQWGSHERARGFAAFSLDYRLTPAVRWPTPLNDVKVAINWIRAHASTFGLDLRRGFVMGHSAGGLLTSVAALESGQFLGAIDVAGAVDPLTEFESATDPHLRTAALALMGNVLPIDDPKRWASARAVNFVGRHRFAFLIMQSRGDLTVPYSSSTQFAAALKAKGYPVTVLGLAGADHELRSAQDVALQDRWMDDVLRTVNG